jgi:hypothetical protein
MAGVGVSEPEPESVVKRQSANCILCLTALSSFVTGPLCLPGKVARRAMPDITAMETLPILCLNPIAACELDHKRTSLAVCTLSIAPPGRSGAQEFPFSANVLQGVQDGERGE